MIVKSDGPWLGWSGPVTAAMRRGKMIQGSFFLPFFSWWLVLTSDKKTFGMERQWFFRWPSDWDYVSKCHVLPGWHLQRLLGSEFDLGKCIQFCFILFYSILFYWSEVSIHYIYTQAEKTGLWSFQLERHFTCMDVYSTSNGWLQW